MPIRDLFLFAFVIIGTPFFLRNPFYGILTYHWFGIMNPHRFTWGPAYAFSFAKVIAIVTIIGLFTGSRNPLPKQRETYLIFFLIAFFTLTSFFAIYPDRAWAQWDKVMKVMGMTIITMMLCCDKEKLHALVIVAAFSIAFFGLKGGIFGITTGGQFRVWGPPASFIADNNSMGLAFNMTIPLLIYLGTYFKRIWLKNLTYALVPLTVLACLLTFSRGAVITLGLVILFIMIRSRRKFLTIITVAAIAVFVSFYLTDRFSSRMQTVESVSEDASFMGRVNAWHYSWNLALDRPLTGGGFENVSAATFSIYAPDPGRVHDYHNIYFEILGEHGFIALAVFLLIFYGLWFHLGRLRTYFKGHTTHSWISDLSNALQISLFAYLFNGLTLGMSYFDLAWLMVAVGIMLKTIAQQTMSNQDDQIQQKTQSDRMEVVH